MDYVGDLHSSRDIVPGPIEAFLLSPHNVNYHLSHHLHPSVPFFNLDKLHLVLMQEPRFAENSVRNTSYILPKAGSLWSDVLINKQKPGASSTNEPEQRAS